MVASATQKAAAASSIARLPTNPSTCTLTPAPMEPMYAWPAQRMERRYAPSRRGYVAVPSPGWASAAAKACNSEPDASSRKYRGTTSNAKSVRSARRGTPQPYLRARSVVKYPPLIAREPPGERGGGGVPRGAMRLIAEKRARPVG